MRNESDYSADTEKGHTQALASVPVIALCLFRRSIVAMFKERSWRSRATDPQRTLEQISPGGWGLSLLRLKLRFTVDLPYVSSLRASELLSLR